MGTVPFLVCENVEMTESSAIIQYLATRFRPDMDIPTDDPEYAEYLNWLHRSDATFTFPLAVVLRYSRFEQPERQIEQATNDYIQFFLSRIKSVERSLIDGRRYLLGETF